MTRHTDFEDDYPEGISADAFPPIDPGFTRGEKIMLVTAGLFASYCLWCLFDAFRDWVAP